MIEHSQPGADRHTEYARIGDLLTAARVAKRLTMGQVAEQVGAILGKALPQSQYANCEMGLRRLSPELVAPVAQVLDLNPADLWLEDYERHGDTAAGLALMRQGMRSDVLAEVAAALKDEHPANKCLDAYLYMPARVEAGRQLVVRLKFEGEDVSALDIREELLEALGDDPQHYAEQIKAVALELRGLADEVLALLPPDEPTPL